MKLNRILVLLLALGQIGTAYFGGFEGDTSSYNTAIITPAGYAFSIWGVITIGCIAYGIYQCLPSQQKNTLFDEMSWPLIATFAGFSMWIFAAARDFLWLTVFIFIAMFVGLLKAYEPLQHRKKKFRGWEGVLLYGTFGLYIGWSAAAIPLNIAAALVYNRILYPDERSVVAYILVLAVALAGVVLGQKRIENNLYYTGTVLWAFIAIFVATFQRGSGILAGATIVALIIFMSYIGSRYKLIKTE